MVWSYLLMINKLYTVLDFLTTIHFMCVPKFSVTAQQKLESLLEMRDDDFFNASHIFIRLDIETMLSKKYGDQYYSVN